MASFKFHCPHCLQPIEVDDKYEGEVANCPSCDQPILVTREADDTSPPPAAEPAKNDRRIEPAPHKPKEKIMKEYKILSQKDKWFSGKFDPDNLEKAINSYAQQGWRVVSAATATFPGLIGGHREEMVVILERDK